MKYSLNGPLSGSVPVILVVEKYIALLRTLNNIEPSRSMSKLYTFNTGFTFPDDDNNESIFKTPKMYYKFRLRGNTQAFIRVLSEYIMARLDMLDEIPQGRQHLDLDISKAIKYYYNLSRHSASEIQQLALKKKRGYKLDRRDLNRLMSRISMESMFTFSQLGQVSPNPRCDDAVKLLITELTPEFIKIAGSSPTENSIYADLLQMYANITRLYYGAANTRDRDPQRSDNIISIEETDRGDGPLRIGNDVVACLPSPNLDLLYTFHDPDAQVISNKALDYVSYLDNSYLRRM